AAAWLLQLANRLRLNLANTLPGNLENMTNFFQRVAVAVAQAVTELGDLALTIAERLKDLRDLAAKHLLGCADRRALCARIGEQVAKVAVFAVADWPIEADRVAAHGQHAAGFFNRAISSPGCLFDRRLATQPLQQ